MTEYDAWADAPARPDPDCKVCKGAGFVHPRVDGLVNYSKLITCPAPGCYRANVGRALPAETQRQTFDTFKPVPGTAEALKYAKQLAYAKGAWIWLLLYGKPGNGKTHLGNAIMKVARERGDETYMILAADLFARLREAMERKQSDQLLRRFKELFFLVIDDYGVEYGSDWEQAKFDELMTARFANGRPTVLITNKDLAELPDRVRSRFEDKKLARIACNAGPDYRGQK